MKYWSDNKPAQGTIHVHTTAQRWQIGVLHYRLADFRRDWLRDEEFRNYLVSARSATSGLNSSNGNPPEAETGWSQVQRFQKERNQTSSPSCILNQTGHKSHCRRLGETLKMSLVLLKNTIDMTLIIRIDNLPCGKQITICWYVDNVKISFVNELAVMDSKQASAWCKKVLERSMII